MLEVKNKYGRDLIYPSCHIANALIKLKDKKTFNKNDLDVFKSFSKLYSILFMNNITLYKIYLIR